MASWAYLPAEMVVEIFRYVDTNDVLSGMRVCVMWKNALEGRRTWENRFYRDFNIKKTSSIIDPRLPTSTSLVEPAFCIKESSSPRLMGLCPWRERYCQQMHILENWKHGRCVRKTVDRITFNNPAEIAAELVDTASKPLFFDGTHLILKLTTDIKVWHVSETGEINKQGSLVGLERSKAVMQMYIINGTILVLQPNSALIFTKKFGKFSLKSKLRLPNIQREENVFQYRDYVHNFFDGKYFALAYHNSNGTNTLYCCRVDFSNRMEPISQQTAIQSATELTLKISSGKLYINAERASHFALLSYDIDTKTFTTLFQTYDPPSSSQFILSYAMLLYMYADQTVVVMVEISTGCPMHTIELSRADMYSFEESLPYICIQKDHILARHLDMNAMRFTGRFPFKGILNHHTTSMVSNKLFIYTHRYREMMRLVLRNVTNSSEVHMFPPESSYVSFKTSLCKSKLFGISRQDDLDALEEHPEDPEYVEEVPPGYALDVLHFW